MVVSQNNRNKETLGKYLLVIFKNGSVVVICFIFSSEYSGKFVFATRNINEDKKSTFSLFLIDHNGKLIGEHELWNNSENNFILWEIYEFNDNYLIDASNEKNRYLTLLDNSINLETDRTKTW